MNRIDCLKHWVRPLAELCRKSTPFLGGQLIGRSVLSKRVLNSQFTKMIESAALKHCTLHCQWLPLVKLGRLTGDIAMGRYGGWLEKGDHSSLLVGLARTVCSTMLLNVEQLLLVTTPLMANFKLPGWQKVALGRKTQQSTVMQYFHQTDSIDINNLKIIDSNEM